MCTSPRSAAARTRPRSTVDHWNIEWAVPSSSGGYLYTFAYLSTKKFTRQQALAFCEAMENWLG
ncbi:MAG: hypothetical protein ACR2H3_03225 [Acidimicrobiales bacterium]